MGIPQHPQPAVLPEAPAARHLGDLARSQVRWSVYLETRSEGRLAEGRLRPHVSHVLPLARTAEAIGLLLDRQSTGKVVVRIDD